VYPDTTAAAADIVMITSAVQTAQCRDAWHGAWLYGLVVRGMRSKQFHYQCSKAGFNATLTFKVLVDSYATYSDIMMLIVLVISIII